MVSIFALMAQNYVHKDTLKTREGSENGDQRIHDHLHSTYIPTYVQVSTVCIECR